jgi:hypothetical protein
MLLLLLSLLLLVLPLLLSLLLLLLPVFRPRPQRPLRLWRCSSKELLSATARTRGAPGAGLPAASAGAAGRRQGRA